MTDTRKSRRWRSPDEPCLNCGDATPGRFCPSCGQRKVEVLVSVRSLVADAIEDQLAVNRALPRTLFGLMFKPGFLTEEYIRGRIVRYIAPFRLYLVTSVVFFLLMSFIGVRGLQIDVTETPDDPGAAAAALDSVAASLRTQQEELQGADTTAMSDSARAALQQTLDGVAASLEAMADSGVPGVSSGTLPAGLSTDSALPQGARQPWAREINFNGSSPLFRRALERKLAQVGHLPLGEALRELARDLLEYAPHMVFLLLPLFAAMLKLLYIRRDRYYAEHFVFALHVHAFVFIMFTIAIVLPWDWITPALLLWVATYIWLALRRVYRQGWVRTTLKWWTLGWMYFWFLLFGAIGLAVVTLLLT